MRRTLFPIITFALAMPLAAETIAPLDAPLPAETLATGVAEGARMTVPVMINGKGPFHFIVDTGADRSVISREVATQLALPDAGKARLVSMSGVENVRTVKIDSLQISSHVTRKMELPALAAKDLGADGLLGIDSLKNHRVVLDFVGQTMALELADTKAIRKEPDLPGTITVTAQSRYGHLVLVDADANGRDIRVIMDTGGQNSVGNKPLRDLMVRHLPASRFKPIELLSVVGDRVSADYVIAGPMRIGGMRLENNAIAFVQAHPFRRLGLEGKPAMLLGMESLRAFRRVSIDFANKRVKFLMPEKTGI